MIIKGLGTQFTTSKIFAGALLFTDTRAFDESFLSDCAMPRNAHSYCSEQSNTKPPTDAPLTAVLPGINTLRERIHHNTDQSTSKVTVRLDRGDRTACKVTALSRDGESRIRIQSSHPIKNKKGEPEEIRVQSWEKLSYQITS